MDKKFMKRALELAALGRGKVNPNPMVGAVIVKEGKIIGEGYHKAFGKGHAEVDAFNNAREDVKGATMYITLEPCSHYGKTPPCADKIIKEGISKVVIGSLDPNPLVSGRGIEKLKNAGIEVITGVFDEENKKLNEVFFKYIVNKRPFVTMKFAMSLDGKIATRTGESKWISCEESRNQVQKLRNEHMGILVGVDTVIKDDPQLTCRLKGGRSPIRIVVDTTLRIPMEANVVKGAKEVKTIVVTTKNKKVEKEKLLESSGVSVLEVASKNNKVDLEDMIDKLGKLGIDGILLEGGGTLNYSAVEAGIVDKVQVYISPKIIGGKDAKTPVEGSGIDKLKDVFKIKDMSIKRVGEDLLIEGYFNRKE